MALMTWAPELGDITELGGEISDLFYLCDPVCSRCLGGQMRSIWHRDYRLRMLSCDACHRIVDPTRVKP